MTEQEEEQEDIEWMRVHKQRDCSDLVLVILSGACAWIGMKEEYTLLIVVGIIGVIFGIMLFGGILDKIVDRYVKKESINGRNNNI